MSLPPYTTTLAGGHPNSLGNTVAVVQEVLTHPEKFEELFSCYFCDDEVVRLRVSNAMKRIQKEKPELVIPYIQHCIDEVFTINQASTQWTMAQLFLSLESHLTKEQKQISTKQFQHNLTHHTDWIVLHTSMAILTHWSKQNSDLQKWLKPVLIKLSKDPRKSVSKKAQKYLEELE